MQVCSRRFLCSRAFFIDETSGAEVAAAMKPVEGAEAVLIFVAGVKEIEAVCDELRAHRSFQGHRAWLAATLKASCRGPD